MQDRTRFEERRSIRSCTAMWSLTGGSRSRRHSVGCQGHRACGTGDGELVVDAIGVRVVAQLSARRRGAARPKWGGWASPVPGGPTRRLHAAGLRRNALPPRSVLCPRTSWRPGTGQNEAVCQPKLVTTASASGSRESLAEAGTLTSNMSPASVSTRAARPSVLMNSTVLVPMSSGFCSSSGLISA